ncbi:MAG: response regulator transcription factor [Acidimicrobiales bacterium]|jgi:two-component system KDP operon response regulator KdpE|nr:response regulator transcription factor [Acidimicrobiales bacterium]
MSNGSHRILIVDDERALRLALRAALQARGLEVVEASSGVEGTKAVAEDRPDLVLLDLGLGDVDGVEVLSRIRTFSDVPVIVLTARDDRDEKVAALDAGADDYVTKPFDSHELSARIRAALRRAPERHDVAPRVVVGDVVIDLPSHTVTRAGERVPMTRTELALLEAFVTNPGRLLTHRWLLRTVWGEQYGTETTYLRTYVAQLRRKLGDDAAHPSLIATEPGMGYRWLA